jgi:hypothetical protein
MFENCIASAGARLLLIGYGFGDAHINKAIAQASTEKGLSVYIIDPTPPRDLLSRMRNSPSGDTIIEALKGVYSHPLKELFPTNQAETSHWRMVQDQFFGRLIR